MTRKLTKTNHGNGATMRWSRRMWAILGVGVVVFALAGDRGVRSATGPVDPLELLKLEAKANAFIILDTSGSMAQTILAPDLSSRSVTDDYPISRLATAKTVLRQVIADNQTTVAFAFGNYTQDTTRLPTSGDRFAYFTTSVESPGMVSNEIVANRGGTMYVGRSSSATYTFAENGVTYYGLRATRFVNGVTYTVQRDGDYCSETAGTPTNPPTVTLIRTANTNNCSGAVQSRATFTFAGVPTQGWGSAQNASCVGYSEKVALAPCDRTDQLEVGGIGQFLEPALPLSADGLTIAGYAENASGGIVTQPPLAGLRSEGYTPIANTLISLQPFWDTLWTTRIAAQTVKQSTFSIIVTDGDDTCGTAGAMNMTSLDNNALRAAHKAQLIYGSHNDGVTSASRFKTFVIFFGVPSTGGGGYEGQDRANWIAWGGTGMTRGTTGSGSSARWASAPSAADRAACTTCVDAFTASSAAGLTAALKEAISLGLSEGTLADRSVLASIYEYGATPLNPDERYTTYNPVLIQSSWELPGFRGHLQAFTNVAGVAAERWDASARMLAMVPDSLIATHQPFANLTSLITRRIYTTSGSGSNPSYNVDNLVAHTGLQWNRVQLWPPEATVQAGSLDGAFGISSLSFADLKSLFGGCAGTTNVPAACSDAGAQLARARLEARQTILAHMAGAEVAGGVGAPERRSGSGDILYRKRTWILADATMASPAISPPPARGSIGLHSAEYGLYANGARSGSGEPVNGLAAGFGLTMPDTTSTASDTGLKPVMTVVYHSANDMLHAFRAGPCPGGTCADTGGEELWGFVPFDQLDKLARRVTGPNSRTDHIYTIAAPVRLAEVFVPGAFDLGSGQAGSGVWRRVLIIGRGAGGKYLTALDVTMPGITTTAASSSNPPIVMWSRTYPGMGETWSVPAVGPVDPAVNVDVNGHNAEFVAYVGSGPSEVAGEGTTFYALNVIDGDVIAQHDIGSGTATQKNAIIASPSLFQPNLLTFSTTNLPLAAGDRGTFVYFVDLHGRVFRFDTANPATAPTVLMDYGPTQPFGVPTMLMGVNSDGTSVKPHVFAETGADERVADDGAFRMVNIRDSSGLGEQVFSVDFPARYRGTVQPAGAFDSRGQGVAVFAGTKFTPAGTECFSRFDSVLYMMNATNDNAAYDLPDEGGRGIYVPNQKIMDIGIAGGGVYARGGLNPEVPPPPPTRPGVLEPAETVSVGPPQRTDPSNLFRNMPAYPGTTTFKLGTSVCR